MRQRLSKWFFCSHLGDEQRRASFGPDEREQVSVNLSISRISSGSIRGEWVIMIKSRSAATTAVLAINGNGSAREISHDTWRERLLAEGQVLEMPNRAFRRSR